MRKAKGGKGERKKDHLFWYGIESSKKTTKFWLLDTSMGENKKAAN